MHTQRLQPRDTAEAAEILRRGGLLGIPTETVYGLGESCGAIVGILAPRELRIRRIMAREGISEDYARKRVESQQGDGFFRTHCDYLLENRADDTPEAFQARAKQLFERILCNRN